MLLPRGQYFHRKGSGYATQWPWSIGVQTTLGADSYSRDVLGCTVSHGGSIELSDTLVKILHANIFWPMQYW